MLAALRNILLTVLPTVIYAHVDPDYDENQSPPFIVYQEVSKRPPTFSDDKPVYYERTIQITLITKKKDVAIEENLERVLLENDYAFSLTTEYKNSDGSIYRVYEIKMEEFTHV